MSFGETVWDEIAEATLTGRALGGVACAVATHAQELGASARLVSAVGADTHGEQALTELAKRELETRWIEVIPGAHTARVLVQRDPSGPRYSALSRLDWSHVSFDETLTRALDGADALAFALFLQGVQAPLDTVERALASSAKRPGWVACDLNLRHAIGRETLLRAVALVDFVKLNEAELARVAQECSAPDAAAFLLERNERLAFVVETRGSRGARVWLRERRIEFPAPVLAPPAHSLGAGDALMAALLCALVGGEAPESALRFAVGYASEHVARRSRVDSQ